MGNNLIELNIYEIYTSIRDPRFETVICNIIFDTENQHVRCFAHIINLAAQDAPYIIFSDKRRRNDYFHNMPGRDCTEFWEGAAQRIQKRFNIRYMAQQVKRK
ncbi:unnamed protein product [Rhizophagus irregularis]|nr:unnamed protein product [Rhizophagus irregularis]